MCIWGNHSATQYPDAWNGTVDKDGKTVKATEAVNNDEWLKSEFITTVQVNFKIPLRNIIFKLANSWLTLLLLSSFRVIGKSLKKIRFLVFYRYFEKKRKFCVLVWGENVFEKKRSSVVYRYFKVIPDILIWF